MRHIVSPSHPKAFIIAVANDQWWNDDIESLEVFDEDNVDDYKVSAGSEFGDTNVYPWAFPSGVPAGQYTVIFFDEEGELIEAGVVDWSGSELRLDANVTRIDGSSEASEALKTASLDVLTGAVVAADSTANSTTAFDTDLAQKAANYYAQTLGGPVLVFVPSSGNEHQKRRVISSEDSGANTRLTVEFAFSAVPTVGDEFFLLGHVTQEIAE